MRKILKKYGPDLPELGRSRAFYHLPSVGIEFHLVFGLRRVKPSLPCEMKENVHVI